MGLFQKISQGREFLEEIFKILYYYRGRVVFSFAGVALGILSICIIITTIEGANKKAKDIFEVLGPDSIMVFSGGERQRAARMRISTLTFRDADALQRIEGIYDLMKVYQVRNVIMRHRDRKWQTHVVGATTNYFESFSWSFTMGSAFTGDDYDHAEAVCVIGSKVYDELFNGDSALGKTILVGKLPAKVIGILRERGGAAGGPNIDDRVIMPLTTVTSRITNEKKYLGSIRLKTNRDLDRTVEDVRTVLRTNHGLQGASEDDFTIRSSKDILKFVTVISGQLFLFLGLASIVALVVSGFVLANLFYLTIQERRKDIGIRRAYGASRKGILLSFLFESVLITLMGGAAGILLSVVLGGTFEKLFDIPMLFTYKVIVFAMSFSFLTGLLSGLRPALRASRIEPIEAIRG
ncbi:ABC transporter permease [Syntrophorhabdus aromaticivorans]|uniref:FtsX-like permease family protein n=1 Tax=Syntrophorhabdus aromaticivorans TaxID=328301 RepID=A0A351U0E8_9BACT|nr:ABC transporter permease [Syntrophorhabdus aromaticivorans]NLW35541.1 FtsX-like permease family protein [Syntrophorhabdus aromaticivorans]HBA53429.1 multidrug ABC transporter substrate-binding protein [Syntrophorhabdus aromaticivorans]